MNYTVQELALQYAEAMVRFHQAVARYDANSDIDAALAVLEERNQARDAMYDAQDRLNTAAKRHVDLMAHA